MTEDEWLACTDPTPMLVFLRHSQVQSVRTRFSDRKARLFACACCSEIEEAIMDVRSKEALSTARRFSEGTATRQELDAARDDAWKAKHDLVVANATVIEISAASAAAYVAAFPASRYAIDAAGNAAHAAPRVAYDGLAGNFMDAVKATKRKQVVLLCDIIGNPFLPMTIKPNWITPSVFSMAQHDYNKNAFINLPLLGDALDDLGCDDKAILDHCRQATEHVRGC
jgi:hypothetical protein